LEEARRQTHLRLSAAPLRSIKNSNGHASEIGIQLRSQLIAPERGGRNLQNDRTISRGPEQQIVEQVSEYLKQTPIAVGVIVMSFFSGHLWVFIITGFLRSKTRGNKLLESRSGRTAIGVLWFTGVSAPLYVYRYHNYNFEYRNILEIAIPTLVTGLLVQLIIFALFASFGDRK
jgi:hypothetical protein